MRFIVPSQEEMDINGDGLLQGISVCSVKGTFNSKVPVFFADSVLANVTLSNSHLTQLTLSSSHFFGLRLEDTLVATLGIEGGSAGSLYLSESQVSYLTLGRSQISSLEFVNSTSRYIDGLGTILDNLRAVDSDISGAEFLRCLAVTLYGTRAVGMKPGDQVSFLDITGSDISESDFSGISLGSSSISRISNTVAVGVDFTNSWLPRVDWTGSDITGAKFEGTLLHGGILPKLSEDREWSNGMKYYANEGIWVVPDRFGVFVCRGANWFPLSEVYHYLPRHILSHAERLYHVSNSE